MKRIVAIIMALTMLCGIASAAVSPYHQEVLAAMDIMTFFDNGSFDDLGYVTRAQLAKIAVMSSTSRNLVSNTSKTSPFGDVPYTHWGAPYISVTAAKGYMRGYTDGAFRPDQPVLFEEAVTVVMRMLGYDNADFAGAYPQGALDAADNIGILDDVNAMAGAPLIRAEMAKILYNMLNTNPKEQTRIYAATLGYNVVGGEISVGDVLKENAVTYKSASDVTLASPKVYIDGKSAAVTDLQMYDIIYQSAAANAIWAYRDKATGILDSVLPNKDAPTAVVVSGKQYQLSNTKAFGVNGLEVGTSVTLLLGRDGNVADAYATSQIYKSQIGVVIGCGNKELPGGSGNSYYMTVLLPNGETIDVRTERDAKWLLNNAVQVKFGDVVTAGTAVSNKTVSGMFLASGTLGNNAFIDNITILDVDEAGNIGKIPKQRLDGVTLTEDMIKVASRNNSGLIDAIILNDVTGDMKKYGVIISSTRNNQAGASSYKVDIGGVATQLNFMDVIFNAGRGAASFRYRGQSVDDVLNLEQIVHKAASVNYEVLTTVSGDKYRVSPTVAVYKPLSNGGYILSTMEEAMKASGKIEAYYDKPISSGGAVRVIFINN